MELMKFFLIFSLCEWCIGCPKNVCLSHILKFFDPKKPLDLDTDQQNKHFSRNFLWDKGTFFLGHPIKQIDLFHRVTQKAEHCKQMFLLEESTTPPPPPPWRHRREFAHSSLRRRRWHWRRRQHFRLGRPPLRQRE